MSTMQCSWAGLLSGYGRSITASPMWRRPWCRAAKRATTIPAAP